MGDLISSATRSPAASITARRAPAAGRGKWWPRGAGATSHRRAGRALSRDHELLTIGLTGTAPNELAEACDIALCMPATDTATIQELRLVAMHLLCGVIDRDAALRSARRVPRRVQA
jgi:D-sedoheptulose 7-phosphate isomerase